MKILSVYSLPGKWYIVKYAVAIILLSIRKFIVKFFAWKDLKPGYGVQSHASIAEMDGKQTLSNNPKAFDAVYINGANRTGWYLIAGLACRQQNVDGFLIIKVPGIGLLLSPKLPNTILRQSEIEKEHFSSEGLTFTPLQPMKVWRLQYNGEMRLSHNRQKKIHVCLNAIWKSECRFFNYDTDMLTKNVAKSMSTEVWTPSYFKWLRDYHQTHYEQFGELTGTIIIDDVEFNIHISAMRDHSFGIRREWKAFHRYVLHIFTLADGSRGNAGVVCIPNVFSRLEIGYFYEKNGSLLAISELEFDLYQHGENGIPPVDYGFRFKAGKQYYEVHVHVETSTELFIGLDWDAKIIESLCCFNVNGVEGWGVVEWMYAHSGGRLQMSN